MDKELPGPVLNQEAFFPFQIYFSELQPTSFASSFSNSSVSFYDLGKGSLEQTLNLPNLHEKRINEIFLNEATLYSCSNDGTVKMTDIRENKLIKTFNKRPLEIYSISLSKFILAGSSKERVVFWDLRNLKEKCVFDESFSDEVTKIEFSKIKSNLLLTSSLDGTLALFDLGKENEEDSIETMLRLEQPLNSCGFSGNFGNEAFAISTVNTIFHCNLVESIKLFEHNAIENNENNTRYLLETFNTPSGSIKFVMGDQTGILQEYSFSKNPIKTRIIKTTHSGQIRCFKYIPFQDLVITGGEDGRFEINKPEDCVQNFEIDFDEESKTMFVESEDIDEKFDKGFKKETITDLEADLAELTTLLKQATRPNVKNMLSREMSQFQDALKQEKSKLEAPAENQKESSEAAQVTSNKVDTDSIIYTAITKYSFEQEGDFVKIYFLLDNIGAVTADNISFSAKENSFDLKIRGYQGKNLRFQVPKLEEAIEVSSSKHVVKKNSLVVTLKKKKSKQWERLHYKENTDKDKKPDLGMDKNEDPQAGLMNMMKKMYQEGDDDMKRTIAQAWTKSQEEKGMKI